MLIPENILYNFIKSCLILMREDYNTNTADPTKSILYTLFNKDDNDDNLVFESYNYFDQAKELFARANENPRQVSVNIGYNMQRANMPTMHLILANERKGRYDSIGHQSIIDNIYDVEEQSMTSTKETSYAPTYSVLFSSANSSEVMLMYYWLRAMFVIFSEHLELKGIKNLTMSGQDLVFDNSFLPNVAHRNMGLDFDYTSRYEVTIPTEIASKINSTLCIHIGDEYNQYINDPNI